MGFSRSTSILDAAFVHCTTRLENTHGTELRELLYRWHPWFGLRVGVPLAVLPTPPAANPSRRHQRAHNIEANTGLQHPLSTLHERHRRRSCKIRFRLAGFAFAGGRTLWITMKGFRLHPSSFPGLCPVARVVYSKRPFGGPKAVLAYLARYTHRVPIANRRLIAADATGVTFKWKDYRTQVPTDTS